MVHFQAAWAPQCSQMNDVMGELAKENKHTMFVKVHTIPCDGGYTMPDTHTIPCDGGYMMPDTHTIPCDEGYMMPDAHTIP